MDAQILADGLFHTVCAIDVASGALAQHNKVLAYGLQPELGIESGDAQYLGRGAACLLGDVINRVHGQIAVEFLCFLQNGDQVAGAVLRSVKNGVQGGQINLFAVTHDSKPLLFLIMPPIVWKTRMNRGYSAVGIGVSRGNGGFCSGGSLCAESISQGPER